MATGTRPGAVIFTGDKERLARFYEAMTGLPVRVSDRDVAVLRSDAFELVIHALPGEPPVGRPALARRDVHIKPFFPVASLSEAREKATGLGGQLRPRNEEWEARGFRACEATDPDGNVIQFREDAPQQQHAADGAASGKRDSINKTARLAGGLYLALIPFAVFGYFYVPSALRVPGDAATTCRNILASEWLFRSGTVSWLVSHIILIFLVLVLYRLLKPVSKAHAVLMVVLALLSIPIVFLNEVYHLAALQLLKSAQDGTLIDSQLHAQVMLFLDMRQSGVLVAQVFYGLWLLPLGILVFRSGFLPRLLGVLVVIAAAGYLIDSGTQLQFPGFATISQFTFVGELLFPLWLLIKGVSVERWRQLMPA